MGGMGCSVGVSALLRLGVVVLALGGNAVQAADAATVAEVKKVQGIAELQQGNYDAARRFLRQSLELNAQDPAAHYYLGLALSRAGQESEALSHFDIATLSDTLRPAAQFAMAQVHYREGDYAKAAPLLRQVLEAEPANNRAIYYLALCDYHHKHYTSARNLLEKVIREDESLRPSAAFMRLGVLFDAGDYREAEAGIEAYRKDYPDSLYSDQLAILSRKLEEQAMRERKWLATLSLGYGYDSNIALLADDERINLQKEDRIATASVEGKYVFLNDQVHHLDAGAAFLGKSYQREAELDIRRVSAFAEYRYRKDANYYGIGYLAAATAAGGEHYRNSHSLYPYLTLAHSKSRYSSVRMLFTQLDYQSAANRDDFDSNRVGLTLNHTYNDERNRSYLIDAGIKLDDARDSTNDREEGSVAFGYHFSWAALRSGLGVKYRLRRYPNSNDEREDGYLEYSLKGRYPLNPKLYLDGEVSYGDNDSNMDVYSYTRTQVALNLVWKP